MMSLHEDDSIRCLESKMIYLGLDVPDTHSGGYSTSSETRINYTYIRTFSLSLEMWLGVQIQMWGVTPHREPTWRPRTKMIWMKREPVWIMIMIDVNQWWPGLKISPRGGFGAVSAPNLRGKPGWAGLYCAESISFVSWYHSTAASPLCCLECIHDVF